MADGSITLMRAGGVSVVPALAAAFPAICLDRTDNDLDGEHHPHILRLASAQDGTAVAGSRLGHAAGVRISGDGGRNRGLAQSCTCSNVPCEG